MAVGVVIADVVRKQALGVGVIFRRCTVRRWVDAAVAAEQCRMRTKMNLGVLRANLHASEATRVTEKVKERERERVKERERE